MTRPDGTHLRSFGYKRETEVTVIFCRRMSREEIYQQLTAVRIPPTAIKGVTQMQGAKVTLFAENIEAADEIEKRITGRPSVRAVSRYDPDLLQVKLQRVPAPFDNCDIKQAMEIYGDVKSVKMFKDKRGWITGNRDVYFKKSTFPAEGIHRFIQLGPVYVRATYDGQPPYCEFCNTAGHEYGNCPDRQPQQSTPNLENNQPEPDTDNLLAEPQKMDEEMEETTPDPNPIPKRPHTSSDEEKYETDVSDNVFVEQKKRKRKKILMCTECNQQQVRITKVQYSCATCATEEIKCHNCKKRIIIEGDTLTYKCACEQMFKFCPDCNCFHSEEEYATDPDKEKCTKCYHTNLELLTNTTV